MKNLHSLVFQQPVNELVTPQEAMESLTARLEE
jgi:hypothetical protein